MAGWVEAWACKRCRVTKSFDRFTLYRGQPSRLCKVCKIAASTQTKLREQGGLCALCHKPESTTDGLTGRVRNLAVDHDSRCCPKPPTCGTCNRGLLCFRCNTSLHAVETNESWLEAALLYTKERGVVWPET